MERPLLEIEYQDINWNRNFKYPNLVRLRTEMDGSCFFHALAKAYCRPYIEGRYDDKSFNRQEFIKDLRQELADMLDSPVNPSDNTSLTYYQTISRGQLPNLSKDFPECSLENMQKELSTSMEIDFKYMEFISDVIMKDIYLLDADRQDVYVVGNEFDILYKGRESIVLYFLPGHFELVGYRTEKNLNIIQTLFPPNHDFILAIQQRLYTLTRPS